MTEPIHCDDGCGLPPEEALKLFSLAFKSDAELHPDFHLSALAQPEQSGSPSLVKNQGGALGLENAKTSPQIGVTAGETANFPSNGRLSGGVESKHATERSNESIAYGCQNQPTSTGIEAVNRDAGQRNVHSGSSAPPNQPPFPAVSDRGLILFAIPETP